MIFPFRGKTQISHGGIPPGFYDTTNRYKISTIEFKKPDLPYIQKDNNLQLKPLQVGVCIDADIDFIASSTITVLSNEDKIYRIKIHCDDAKAISVYYSDFWIPEGGRLFLYDEKRTYYIGSFTNKNNPKGKYFTTEPIAGEDLIIEYVEPASVNELPGIIIDQVGYLSDFNYYNDKGFGDSGPCEVNVNCPEGNDWKEQRDGIAKILVKQSSALFLCSGSLINNTGFDNTPYLLTANHCGKYASAYDYDQWTFYFNYQSTGCENPVEEPDYNSISGSSLIAKAKDSEVFGSDFKLVLLNSEIPEYYDPYFNGWSRRNHASSSGVGIHHPQGDIKKISTYKNAVVSSQYQGTTHDPDGKYWRVTWSETATNYGVTEGGSSGSPLFDSYGYIVGALTGGAASCNNPDGPDYYGKFSFSWESNGSYDSLQLKPWLDPANTGVTELEGMRIDHGILKALFNSDSDTTSIGKLIQFYDLSNGNPTEWEWTFEGGDPAASSDKDPLIKYNNYGQFDVRLIIRKDSDADTLYKENMIFVRPLIGPNPASDYVEIFFGQNYEGEVKIIVYDLLGRKLFSRDYNINKSTLKLDIGLVDDYIFKDGMYILRIQKNESSLIQKLMVISNKND